MWRERERRRSDRDASDDESTPLVGASPLVSPVVITPTSTGPVVRPTIVTRQPTLQIDPADPETTL